MANLPFSVQRMKSGRASQRRYIANAERTRLIQATGLALALSIGICSAGLALGRMFQPVTVTYALDHVDSAGEAWTLDSGLTVDDCRAFRSTYPAGFATCRAVYN